TQAKAAKLLRDSASALLKRLEEPLLGGWFKAHSSVLHFKLQPLIGNILRRHGDGTAAGRELHRVAQQIPQYLLETNRIPHCLRVPGVQADGETLLLGIHICPADFDSTIEHGMEINGCNVQLEFAVGDTREIAQ